MGRTARQPKLETFNFRVDSDLKAAFTAAAQADDRPAAQVLREFMRGYVDQRASAAFRRAARRQSMALAAAAADPRTDEARIIRELDANYEDQFRDDSDL